MSGLLPASPSGSADSEVLPAKNRFALNDDVSRDVASPAQLQLLKIRSENHAIISGFALGFISEGEEKGQALMSDYRSLNFLLHRLGYPVKRAVSASFALTAQPGYGNTPLNGRDNNVWRLSACYLTVNFW